jgi:predicted MFS family arabinose efflux permease
LLEVVFGWPAFFFCMGILAIAIGLCYGHTAAPSARKTDGGSKSIWDALPLIKQAYSIRDVRFLSFAAFFLFLTFIGLMTFAAEYLKEAFALPSDQIGLVLSMTGILGIAVSPVAGMLGDRWGQRQVAYAGGIAMGIAIIGMGVLDYSYGRYLLFFSIFGAGSATVWTAFLTLAVQIEPELRKPVVSFYNCIKFFGYALAPFVFSIFYVSFSITGVRWACLTTVLVSLFLISRIRRKAGVYQASSHSAGSFP